VEVAPVVSGERLGQDDRGDLGGPQAAAAQFDQPARWAARALMPPASRTSVGRRIKPQRIGPTH
jgi:hypothetical protein